MNVKRAKIVGLFVALGFKTAESWSNERLGTKLEKLSTMVDKDTELKDENQSELLKKLLKAQKAGDAITITADEGNPGEEKPAAKAEPAKKAKPPAETEDEEAPKPKAKAKPPADEDDDEQAPAPKKKAAPPPEDDEDEAPAPKKKAKVVEETEEDEDEQTAEEKAEEIDDDEPPTPKKSKGGGAPKGTRPQSAGGDGKPGIIASLAEWMAKTTEEKPLSKKQLLDKLVIRFPDRDPDKMSKTIAVQVPNRLNRDKGLNLIKNSEGGYYNSPSGATGKKKAAAAAEDDD